MNLTPKTDGELIAVIEAMQQVIAETDGIDELPYALHHAMAHVLLDAAEAELDEREQARIQQEIYAELDARREYEALLAAEPNDLPDFSGDEAPF